jgi:hypothetical protein
MADIYDKYFEIMPNKNVLFKGQKMIIQIPMDWIDEGITNITQTTVETLGLFEGYIFDDINNSDITQCDHKFAMKLPCNIIMKPSHITESSKIVENVEKEIMEKVKIFNLVFLQDDVFMVSDSLVQDLNISDKFIYLLLTGQLPETIKYDELPSIWQQCSDMNGSGDLSSNYNTFALIVMNLARDYENPMIQFRHVFEKYYAKGVYNAKMVHYWNIPKFTSGFASLTATDSKYGLTVSMEREATKPGTSVPSPIEEAIK